MTFVSPISIFFFIPRNNFAPQTEKRKSFNSHFLSVLLPVNVDRFVLSNFPLSSVCVCVCARSLAYPALRLPSGSDAPSEIFQTPVFFLFFFFYFVLPPRPASPQPCQVQCGNDKHPLYPSSEVPAALSHRRGSHIFKLSAAPSPGRINLESHKANVSSGHVNEARCARRLGEKGRSRGRTKREAS